MSKLEPDHYTCHAELAFRQADHAISVALAGIHEAIVRFEKDRTGLLADAATRQYEVAIAESGPQAIFCLEALHECLKDARAKLHAIPAPQAPRTNES